MCSRIIIYYSTILYHVLLYTTTYLVRFSRFNVWKEFFVECMLALLHWIELITRTLFVLEVIILRLDIWRVVQTSSLPSFFGTPNKNLMNSTFTIVVSESLNYTTLSFTTYFPAKKSSNSLLEQGDQITLPGPKIGDIRYLSGSHLLPSLLSPSWFMPKLSFDKFIKIYDVEVL